MTDITETWYPVPYQRDPHEILKRIKAKATGKITLSITDYEIEGWVKHNIKGQFIRLPVCYYFEDSSDAIAFKLRWI